MNQQRAKKWLHHQRAYKQHIKAVKKFQQSEMAIWQGNCQYQTVQFAFRFSPDQINSSQKIHQARTAIVDYMLNKHLTSPISRIMLMDYDYVKVSGLVADVKVVYDHQHQAHASLLIDRPFIIRAEVNQRMVDVNKPLDSHIWIFCDDAVGYDTRMLTKPIISIGDFILINANIKTYRGHTDNRGHYGFKYGLGKFSILGCGLILKHKRKKHMRLCSLLPRGNDWVIRYTRIGTNSDPSNEYVRPKYKIRPSQYPSYYERITNE